MDRRDFIVSLLGGAAAWPLAARAQQPIPVIGFLRDTTASGSEHLVAAFRAGLNEAGFIGVRTSRSSIASQMVEKISCLCWQPIWSAVAWH